MRIASLKIFILIIFAFHNFAVVGQSKFNFYKYRKFYNQAEIAKYQKNYKAEKNYYEKAFKYMKQDYIVNLCYYQYVECLLNNKDTSAAIIAEARYLAIGLINIESPKSILRKFGTKYGSELVNEFPKIKQESEKNPDKENRLAIAELEKRDQEIRNEQSNMPREEWVKLLAFTDSTNFYDLFQLIKYKNANPLCGLIYHLYGDNKKYFNYFDSVYKVKVYAGETTPEAYVQWHDRQRMYVNKMQTQLYGEWNDGANKNQFNPIEDIQNVDKRRAELGLCLLSDYTLLHNLILPKDYPSTKNRKN